MMKLSTTALFAATCLFAAQLSFAGSCGMKNDTTPQKASPKTSESWTTTAQNKTNKFIKSSKKEAGKLGDSAKKQWGDLKSKASEYKLQSPIVKKDSSGS
jgi:hypothetical protein